MGPDDELLGVVVHSGLVLGRRKDVVAALRRITAFPTGLILDTVVLARGIHAQAAGRRQHAATAHRRAAAAAQREDRPPPSTTARTQPSGKASRRLSGTTRCSRPGSNGATFPALMRATSCDSGSPHRPVKRCGWTPMSRRLRRPRTAIGWKPPTGSRRFPLTGCSAWSAPGRRSACRKPRPTSSFRTWRSVRLRPSHCGTPPRILKRNPPRTVLPLLATPAAADSRLTKGQGDPASWVACHRPTLVQDIADDPFRLSDHRPRRGLSLNASPRCWYRSGIPSWHAAGDPSTRKPPARRDCPAEQTRPKPPASTR